jgi:hypothetical protein
MRHTGRYCAVAVSHGARPLLHFWLEVVLAVLSTISRPFLQVDMGLNKGLTTC